MKRFLLSVVILVCLMSIVAFSMPYEIIGQTLYTDIGAYINNFPIKSYNINGKTAVAAKDLADYGFNVTWDEANRRTVIELAESPILMPQTGVYKNGARAGLQEKLCLATDITADIGGKVSECANIDGWTIVYFDDLAQFGEVMWDGIRRSIFLTISTLPQTEYVPLPENPNVTTMYAPGGRTLLVDNDEIEAYLNVGWFLTPPDEKLVALTFDDGPSNHTTRILNCLEQYGQKATFFVVGNRVNNYSSILQRAYNLGMEIGNHTWNHPKLTTLSWDGIISQKTRTDDAVRSITGQNTTVMRPPYGSKNDAVLNAFNQPLILWSIDTRDWDTRNVQSTVDSVMNNVKDGDIILMHDIYEATAGAVEIIVPRLINEGYRLVTVSELAKAKYGGIEIKAYNHMR